MIERRRGVRRPEKEEQLARIAKIVGRERLLYGEEYEEFISEYGASASLASVVIREVKKEGLSTALVVGYFLKEGREKAGLTQEKLAKKAGLSQALICLYERGERLGEKTEGFPSENLLRVVSVLGAPYDNDAYWAIISHFEEFSPTASEVLRAFGEWYLLEFLRIGFIPFRTGRRKGTRIVTPKTP